MEINYELYKVFYYVAKTLSFSEASKKLFISQSAVSQSIKALEKDVYKRQESRIIPSFRFLNTLIFTWAPAFSKAFIVSYSQ